MTRDAHHGTTNGSVKAHASATGARTPVPCET
jgi:hypothetical protein